MTDPAAKAAERIARRKALWECYRLGGNGAVVPSGLFLSAMDEFGHEAARAEHLESVLAKVLRSCDCCSHCEYDEAEGELVRYCDTCCRRNLGMILAILNERRSRIKGESP